MTKDTQKGRPQEPRPRRVSTLSNLFRVLYLFTDCRDFGNFSGIPNLTDILIPEKRFHSGNCRVLLLFNLKFSKTPGYQWDFLRPLNLLNMPFRRMNGFFFKSDFKQKKIILFLHHIFYFFFQLFVSSDFQPKVPQNCGGKTFLWNNAIWDAFEKKFATFSNFEELQGFSEKPIYFWNKNTILCTFQEILLFQSHSTTAFQQFGGKNSRLKMWTNIVLVLKKLEIIGLKTTSAIAFWANDFPFIL